MDNKYWIKSILSCGIIASSVSSSFAGNDIDSLSNPPTSIPQVADKINPSTIKFSPLRLISLLNSGIEMSYKYPTFQHSSTQLSLLVMNVFNTPYNDDGKGLRVGVEQKFYYQKEREYGHYYSVELMYFNSLYHISKMYY